MKKTENVHSDEEDDQEEEEEEEDDEDDMESDTDKSGEDDMEEVRYPRSNRFSTVTLRSHAPFFHFCQRHLLIFLSHFNIMCEQNHRISFNPI